MGSYLGKVHIDEASRGPDRDSWPNIDPLYGFPEGRQERVMKATQAEMESAKVPMEDRGYCAHMYIKYNKCRRDVWPLAYRCAHVRHEFLQCKYDDFVIRMKEYERERRLMERARRKAARATTDELA